MKSAAEQAKADKAEAAEIVDAAKKAHSERLADRETAKNASPEDLQAMINKKLNIGGDAKKEDAADSDSKNE